MVAEGMPQRIGASGRQTVLAVSVGGFGLDCYGKDISDDLEKGVRSSEKQKPQHPMLWRFHANCGLLSLYLIDAEQLSFKKGTTFVRKTMIY